MKLKVNRKQTIKQLLNKLPFENKYLNDEVVAGLKNDGPEEVEIEFFKSGRYLTNSEVLAEYKNHNLIPDLGAILTLLVEQPEVLDEIKYIGVQLEDNKYAALYRGVIDERYVYVGRGDDDWRGDWLFGGVASKSLDSGTLGASESLDTLEIKKYVKQEIDLIEKAMKPLKDWSNNEKT